MNGMGHLTLARQRLYAALIDLAIVLGLSCLLWKWGGIVGIGYWLLRDGCFEGQSIGKRLMGLKVVVGTNRTRCTLSVSAVRNVLWVIPFVNLLMLLNASRALSREPDGRHWGDRLADTTVVSV